MSTQAQQQPEYLGLVVAGYVMAFVLPIGGLITAFAIGEKRFGHCMAISCLSAICGMGWFYLLFAH